MRLSALHVVSADMGKDSRDLVDPPIYRHDWNSGVHGLLKRGRHGIHFIRRDHDTIDAASDRRFHVGRLLRR